MMMFSRIKVSGRTTFSEREAILPARFLRRGVGNLAVLAGLVVLLAISSLPVFAQDKPRESEEDRFARQRKEMTERSAAVVEIPVVDSIYVVGPGDELSINIFGTKYYNYAASVNSDGTIIVPGLGTVYVRNTTLKEVREKMYSLLRSEVRRADIVVTLSHARQVKVSVTGAVREPGVVILPATARVSEALELAGGIISDTASLRNILVKRSDGRVLYADMLRYHRVGDLQANPFVSGGDIIYFPTINKQVGMFGAVGIEGWMDYVEGERLFSLIEACQGVQSAGFLDSVEVVRFHPDHITTFRFFLDLNGYPEDQTNNIEVESGDLVLIRAIPQYLKHKLVLLKGEIHYQGSYAIEQGETTLYDLIMRAGGFTDDASLEEAVLLRKPPENEKDQEFERLQKIPASDMRDDEYEYFKARSRERIGSIVVDFKKLFLEGDTSQNIMLREGDIVEIPKSKDYIRIIGRVNNPGNVIFDATWNYMDYISATGGFGWRADDGDVRVVKARTGELMDASEVEDYKLEPGDTIWIPEVPEVKFWEIALVTLGVIAQIAGILGIVIAVTR